MQQGGASPFVDELACSGVPQRGRAAQNEHARAHEHELHRWHASGPCSQPWTGAAGRLMREAECSLGRRAHQQIQQLKHRRGKLHMTRWRPQAHHQAASQ